MQRLPARAWNALIPVFAATIIASCGESGTPTGPNVAVLQYVSGNTQSGPIGSTLPQPLVVQTVDQNGTAVSGASVTWEVVSGAASLSASTTLTGSNGQASVTVTLGNTIGPVTIRASFGASSTVDFAISAVAATPSRLVIVSGSGQNGTAGSQLGQALVVRVSDALDNPSGGVAVTFTVASGGGALSAGSAVTDAAGVASITWTLGITAGAQSVTATGTGLPTVTFTANAAPDVAAQVIILTGNNLTAPPSTTLPDSLRVQVKDRFGNVISGATVTWTPGAGSGTASPGSSVTDANGKAATTWTLGPIGGPMHMEVRVAPASVTFDAGATVSFATLSAGGRNSCGVTTANVLFCWGYNGEGQLGIGVESQGSGDVFAVPQPSAATGELTFRQVVASLYHGCSVTLASIAYCWGVNLDGRLGDGSLEPEIAPKQVEASISFQWMAVSRNHTCGLSISNRVYCWGYSGEGQVGDGSVPGDTIHVTADSSIVVGDSVLVPHQVFGDLRFQALAAGGQHSCAITTVGAGYCWGFNSSGELGDGSTTNKNVPVPISGGLTLIGVTAGYTHSCALATGGIAYCWGGNSSGQLGNGGSTNSSVPVAVSGGLTFTTISAGMSHTCGVTSAGAVWCWGSNGSGQLGNATRTSSNVPVQASIPAGLVIVSVSAGDLHTCAVTTTNLAYCWGDNQYGQLGDATQTGRLVPTKVAFQP
jgi:alpha-tubulin suppressor-like RCC1 family protein